MNVIEAEIINIQQAPHNIGRQIQNKFNKVFEKHATRITIQCKTNSTILDGKNISTNINFKFIINNGNTYQNDVYQF